MSRPDRRRFLKSSLAGLSIGSLNFAGIRGMALAEAAQPQSRARSEAGSRKASCPLVVVFQRGGADGLSILSPLEDPDFLAARPPGMRIAPTSTVTELGGARFCWHPEAAPIARLYQAQRLAAWQAVGLKNETRSHAEAQEMVERGVHSLHPLPDRLGWLTRQFKAASQAAPGQNPPLSLFARSANLPRALQGDAGALASRDLQTGLDVGGGTAGFGALQSLCTTDRNHLNAAGMLEHLRVMKRLNDAMPHSGNKVLPYETAGATPYPASDPGVGLRSVARVVHAGVGLRAAWVDQGGWDTHEGQPRKLATQLRNLSLALQAFDQDMQARQQPYVLVVLTEFGRRLRSNRSNGTDHGHGGLALLMGDRIEGGKMMGRWPGLASNQLNHGVDLAATTDTLEVLAHAASRAT